MTQVYEYVRVFVSRASYLSVIYADGAHGHYAALHGFAREIAPAAEAGE